VTISTDVLVVGVGGCGASALYHLAKRGVRVIGLDRFEPGHDRGSSHGDTRIIRQAYFEHPDYVPLLRRAYDGWKHLEDETGEKLLDLCGLLLLGTPESQVLRGARLASERHGAALEHVDRKDVAQRFPAIALPEDFEAAWEPLGGHLRVERCVKSYARRAVELGADLHVGETVLTWSATSQSVRVETDRAIYEADRLVLCPGAWAPGLLPDVARQAKMQVLRKLLFWYPRRDDRSPVPDHTFFVELPFGAFYGFPCLDGQSVKLAEHTGGSVVDDPIELDRQRREGDSVGPDRFVGEVLPGLDARATRHAVCMYTMTRDAHFLVDYHPRQSNVVFAAGFSGHGFKFMSALGEILCELALDGQTPSPIDFLGIGRFDTPSSRNRSAPGNPP
jgi:sarcosine oxidase